eukprot:16446953-Heterocapsa_arctica.AAC.1
MVLVEIITKLALFTLNLGGTWISGFSNTIENSSYFVCPTRLLLLYVISALLLARLHFIVLLRNGSSEEDARKLLSMMDLCFS